MSDSVIMSWCLNMSSWHNVITRRDHRQSHEAGRSGNVVAVLWWKWILGCWPHPRTQGPGVEISAARVWILRPDWSGQVTWPEYCALIGPDTPVRALCSSFPVTVLPRSELRASPPDQPSPALPWLAPLQISPGHRDTDFPYATNNINLKKKQNWVLSWDIMDDS